MNVLRSPFFLICIPLLAIPSWADPLAAKAISADATWFVYADLEQFSHTQFCPLFRQEISSLGIDKKVQEFAKVFGFHPIDDIREILLYGVGQDPEKGAVLFRGAFDGDKLLAPIRANGQYQEIARVIRTSQVHVRVLLYRARANMAKKLQVADGLQSKGRPGIGGCSPLVETEGV